MADEKASSLLVNDEQNQSVEMEFKVRDFHDEIHKGWRLACIRDVESYGELVRAELCGMTFNICSLADGTVGGPGLGYQITNTIDNSLDHKLLITDPSTLSSEAVLSDMKPLHVIPDDPVTNGHTSNEHSDNEAIVNDKYSTETNGIHLNTNDILTQETNNSIQTPIYSLENSLDNIQSHSINTMDQPCAKGDIVVNENICPENISNDSSTKVDLSQSKHSDSGSGNDSEVSEATLQDTINKPIVSDLESIKSTDSSSPSTRKKKAKRMSESMQRLTAKKESPEKRTTDLVSASERKAKADELRKKKIIEQRTKDDERRAAVLERRRKLEAAEREKKEALFKKLTTNEEKSGTRPSPMKGRYSLSTSNLSQLKKNKPVDINATTVPKRTENKPKTSSTERPKSAMQRPGMGFPPQKTKSFNAEDRRSVDIKRPMTAFGSKGPSASTKTSTKPSPRQSITVSQPARPATALGISNVEKRKAYTTRQRNASTEKLPTTTAKKPLPKSRSMSSVDAKQAIPIGVDKKKYMERTKERRPFSSPRKEKGAVKKELPTKEEAKIALAERRKKAKEEAEEKALIEREKDEVERVKREENEKRLAEQLRLEEERHAGLLEQLKKDEEERKVKMIEEKEQREREEKERLEEDQRQREEEIERKAKLELDKIQKEQERQELLLDQERIERKKRVEMIMARVSSKRTTGEDAESGTPVDTPPGTTTPPEISTDPARIKVNDILRSRGFGKSTEDISRLLEKYDESSAKTDAAQTKEDDESEVALGQPESNGDSVVADSSISTENNSSIPSDESPLKEETSTGTQESLSPVSLEEAPSTEDILSKEKSSSDAQISVPSLEEETSAGDDDTSSAHINSELCVDVEVSEINLNNNIENNVSLNDTNNNKDFVRSTSPINAWSENNRPSLHNASSNEKIQNHAHNDEPIFLNGNQDETKVVNGSSDLHLTGDLESEENSVDTESKQWNKFDERMKQIPPAVEHPAPGEEKLWKVLEGKVELSECF